MYIDAVHDYKNGKILVIEKDKHGNKHTVEHDAEYAFYYTHPSGSMKSIYRETVKRYSTNENRKFRAELERKREEEDRNGNKKYRIYESDANPVFRCLENNYKGVDAPELNVGFFDIEVGFHKERGYAPTTDPFNEVTAVTMYISDLKRNITLALKPSTYTIKEANEIVSKFEDTLLFLTEEEMLEAFLDLFPQADIWSGWNSSLYDIPYLVNRIRRVLGEAALQKMCLWGYTPRKRMMMKHGKEQETYDLVGITHLDYLELYQKHNPQQLHSYRLDFVGEHEGCGNKVAYEGTLDDLYHKDFEKFIDYSKQDVILLVKIDEKRKYIELANQIAHVNCVLLKTTMGSVSLVEQAIMLEMHDMGMVAPDRKVKVDESVVIDTDGDEDDDDDDDERTPVVGAYVAKPKTGIHSDVGCVDLSSLYPNTIRALNISPETIVGQFRDDLTNALIEERLAKGVKRAEAWDGIFETLEVKHVFDQTSELLTVDFDDGTTKTMTAAKWNDYIFNPKNHLCISANGTLFKTDVDGIIPMLLEKWFSQRKQMQALQKQYTSLSQGEVELPVELVEEVSKLLDK